MKEWMNESLVGWMEGWMDGWVTTQLATCLNCGHVIYVPNACHYNNHMMAKGLTTHKIVRKINWG